MDFLLPSLLTETLLLAPTKLQPLTWDFTQRGYYDRTPPEELSSEIEYPVLNSAATEQISGVTEPLVAVIGVGYVGEHLVSVFSNKHQVIGYDVSETRTEILSKKFAGNTRVQLTTKATGLKQATHFLIAVPTLLLPDKTIDSSFLRSALAAVSLHARRGAVVVIESSVAVGMTRELLGPLAKQRGFFAGMSPERVDPGRTQPPAHAIPKIVSGLDDVVPGSLDAIQRLYSSAFEQVVTVSKPEVAEMMKLYENCQRMVCIAFANEMADACIPLGIDPFEVCEAAKTKPFGYMPFTPGLGVGGHCIPVNPYYLLSNSDFPLLRDASERMRSRPGDIARRAVERLYATPRGDLPRPRVLVVGIGFKPGQSHLANSPGLELAKTLLLTDKVDVAWADPLVKQEAVPQIRRLAEEDWTLDALEHNYDLIIVALRQYGVDFEVLHQLQGVEVEMWCP